MPNMKTLQSEAFILDRREFGQRLQVTAKRYILTGRYGSPKGRQPHRERVTLILAHDAGQHKEQWEPFLEDLQILQADAGDHTQPLVSEAWSVECPNHGESATINQDDLFLNPAPVGCVEYARSILCLLESGLISNSGSPRSVIFVGHGSGATSVVLATHLLRERIAVHPLPYRIHSIFLLDPLVVKSSSISAIELANGRSSSLSVVEHESESLHRVTQTDALSCLSKQEPWSRWDSRCLELFGEYGLRSHSASNHPELSVKGAVVPTCPSDHKTFMLNNAAEHAVASEIMASMSQRLPVHIIFGEDSQFCPPSLELHWLSGKSNTSGPTFASIRSSKAGHTILQEQPTIMARHLLSSLRRPFHGTPSSTVEVQARL